MPEPDKNYWLEPEPESEKKFPKAGVREGARKKLLIGAGANLRNFNGSRSYI